MTYPDITIELSSHDGTRVASYRISGTQRRLQEILDAADFPETTVEKIVKFIESEREFTHAEVGEEGT